MGRRMLEAADDYYKPPVVHDAGYIMYCRKNMDSYISATGNELPDFPLMQGRILSTDLMNRMSNIREEAWHMIKHPGEGSAGKFITDVNLAAVSVRVLCDAMYRVSTKGTWHARIEGFDTDVFENLMAENISADEQKTGVRNGFKDIDTVLDTVGRAFESCDYQAISGTAYYMSAVEMILRLLENRVIDIWNGNGGF